jgi:hypothetical protein
VNKFADIRAAHADAVVRQTYQSPRLSLFGDIGTLTETGSMTAMEDFIQNNSCSNFLGLLNMTGNMC